MSHYTARTMDGKLVTATEAETGVNHACVICGACMRARKCINMSDHFFLFHDTHKSKDCGALEKERGVVRKPELLKRNQFFKRILDPGGRGNGTGGGGGSGSPGKQMRPPNSLCQLIATGVRLMNPFTPIAEGEILSDVFVGRRAYAHCIHECEDLSIRAIDVRLWSARDHKITYTVTWEYRKQKFRAFFIHKVSKELNFKNIADCMFYERRSFGGKDSWHKGRYKLLTVAGDWKAVGSEECNRSCSWCKKSDQYRCLGMWEAELKHEEQLYYSDLPENLIASENKEE